LRRAPSWWLSRCGPSRTTDASVAAGRRRHSARVSELPEVDPREPSVAPDLYSDQVEPEPAPAPDPRPDVPETYSAPADPAPEATVEPPPDPDIE
jgi:hypothetical protein